MTAPAAVLWLGERYYMLIGGTYGNVALLPASEVEVHRVVPAPSARAGRRGKK